MEVMCRQVAKMDNNVCPLLNHQVQAISDSEYMRPLLGRAAILKCISRQYAFNSIPQTADGQMRQRQVLSHAQQAPVRQRMQANGRSQMPPPPTPMHGRQQQLMQTHAQHASIPQQQPTQQPTPGMRRFAPLLSHSILNADN